MQGVSPRDYEVYLGYLKEKQAQQQAEQQPPVQKFSNGGLASLSQPFYQFMKALEDPSSSMRPPNVQGGVPITPPIPEAIQPLGLESLAPPTSNAAPELRPPQSNNPGGLANASPFIDQIHQSRRGFSKGGLVDQMEDYIRASAKSRGIDPSIAVRVARSEGLAPGVWQSNYKKNGIREPSYGPFQLLVGGPGTGYPAGMGNDFMRATGLDPRDKSTWKSQVDFALNNAARGGWGPWYGAAKVGVNKWDGIKGATPAPVNLARTPVPQTKNQSTPTRSPMPAQTPPAGAALAQGLAQGVNATPSPKPKGLFGGLGGLMMMAMSQQAAPPPPPPVMGGSEPVRRSPPKDPMEETARTSLTPNMYEHLTRQRYGS